MDLVDISGNDGVIDKTSVYCRKMNYYETDKMGIIHHSNYIRLFEEARIDMLGKLVVDYRAMEESGIMIPVMFVDCKYLLPLHFDDEIEIHTCLTKFDGIKMEVGYKIYTGSDGKLCTTGHSGHCFLDNEMKPFRMKKIYPNLYRRLKDLVKEENV